MQKPDYLKELCKPSSIKCPEHLPRLSVFHFPCFRFVPCSIDGSDLLVPTSKDSVLIRNGPEVRSKTVLDDSDRSGGRQPFCRQRKMPQHASVHLQVVRGQEDGRLLQCWWVHIPVLLFSWLYRTKLTPAIFGGTYVLSGRSGGPRGQHPLVRELRHNIRLG